MATMTATHQESESRCSTKGDEGMAKKQAKRAFYKQIWRKKRAGGYDDGTDSARPIREHQTCVVLFRASERFEKKKRRAKTGEAKLVT
jgi:hypothetical protein